VRSPTPAALKKLAGVLGVEPGDLLDLPQSEWGQNEWRVTNGLEQKEVAAALGVSPTTLSAVEATYSPFPAGMPERLATLYGTTATEIETAWERDRRRLTTTG
jgi:transcriptional regulator with XRE-family HTH domain